MKEYIERQAAIEAVLGLTIVDPAVAQYANAVYFILHNLPTADVAPVVRCRECVNNHPEFVGNETQWCELYHITINPDDFCSQGQRKEADHD